MTMVAATALDPLAPEALGARARELLERDQWSRDQLGAYQHERLRSLIRHAAERSPYYREVLGRGAEDAALAELPTLPKRLLMEQFDRVVTDQRLRLAGVEPFLAAAEVGARYLDEYRVFTTSGTTGTSGVLVYSQAELAHWTAVMLRAFARLGLGPGTRLVGVGAPSALHISQQAIASLQAAGRSAAPRLSVLTPLDETVAALNEDQPEMLGGYASVMALLAEEQLRGRLSISPRVVLTTSEVLTEDARARIEAAWTTPVQGYFSTEVLVIASDSLDHVGMHVCEDAILEVVDENDRPVSPGTLGSKVLLTNLVNYAQPLIRYELSDAVELEPGPDPSGRPFDRIARVDGRSDDMLRLPGSRGGVVAAPVQAARPLHAAPGCAAVPDRPPRERTARAHRPSGSGPRGSRRSRSWRHVHRARRRRSTRAGPRRAPGRDRA
jgi:phenylacetate-coenzyme A ligase PaaK-like adenylate-forming protein